MTSGFEVAGLKLLVRAVFPAENLQDASLALARDLKGYGSSAPPCQAHPEPQGGEAGSRGSRWAGLGCSASPGLRGSSARIDLWAHKK